MNIELISLSKTFSSPVPITVLDQVNLKLKMGTSTAILGRSGEGKSTLLNILGTLEKPSSGKLLIGDKEPTAKNTSSLRNTSIGFIFQSYHLLEEFCVLDNIQMPALIGRKTKEQAKKRALFLLEKVGLKGKEKVLAKFLSGGEKQRCALARALCNDPDWILADEPTGNLDRSSARQIQDLLLKIVKEEGKGMILATHDLEFAKKTDTALFLEAGKLLPYEEKAPSLQPI